MLLGCSTEESKQALTSVGLVWSTVRIPSRGWTGCSCQGDLRCSHVTELAFPSGVTGVVTGICWISMDPHRAEENPGHDLRGDEMEQEWLLFVTKP